MTPLKYASLRMTGLMTDSLCELELQSHAELNAAWRSD